MRAIQFDLGLDIDVRTDYKLGFVGSDATPDVVYVNLNNYSYTRAFSFPSGIDNISTDVRWYMANYGTEPASAALEFEFIPDEDITFNSWMFAGFNVGSTNPISRTISTLDPGTTSSILIIAYYQLIKPATVVKTANTATAKITVRDIAHGNEAHLNIIHPTTWN